MNSILLVDDDVMIHEIVKRSLTSSLNVITCLTLSEARDILSKDEPPSLILIDRILPDGDGLSLCSEIRSSDHLSAIPVIFLSGCDKESDKLSGFYAGADDYIAKPFSPLEFKARVQARLRDTSSFISYGNITVNTDRHTVKILLDQAPRLLSLTQTEYKLLVILLKNRDKILTREVILHHVWDHGFNVSDRVVDTHLSHLRTKLGESNLAIECLRGAGYRVCIKSEKAEDAA